MWRRRSAKATFAQMDSAVRARRKISGIVSRSVFGTRPTSSKVAGSYEMVSPGTPEGRGPELGGVDGRGMESGAARDVFSDIGCSPLGNPPGHGTRMRMPG